MRRLVASLVILLGVSACESAAGNVALAVLGTNMVSVMYTDKTLLDHGAGAAVGQDCSLLYMEKKNPYCRNWEGQGKSPVALYCYPTLGRPECHVNPLPNRQGRYSLAASNPKN
jgi:hypothetical protein